MPLTTHFGIVSAETLIYSRPVPKVALPAEYGEICILARPCAMALVCAIDQMRRQTKNADKKARHAFACLVHDL
jgi:F0F1-type ATP synthase epsilon subunit